MPLVNEREQKALSALRLICDAIVETCKESEPMGAPGGILYVALMQYGITLGAFEGIMAGLVQAGKLRKSGDCYHAV